MTISKKISTNLTILLFLCFLNCKNTQKSIENDNTKKIEFSLTTTSCYGTCPVFTFEIYTDGNASYIGEKHVDLEGSYNAKLDEKDRTALFNMLGEINYFEMKLKNDFTVKDLPTKYFYASIGDKESKITYYSPKSESMDELYELVNKIIRETNWIKS